jgi:hypothetical protein
MSQLEVDAGCGMLDDGTREEEGGLEDAGDEGIISFLLIFLLPGRGSTNASRVSEAAHPLADDAIPGTSFPLPTSKQASKQANLRSDVGTWRV